MNIKVVLAAVIVLVAVSCTRTDVEQDYKIYEVHGKVKTISIKEGDRMISEIAFNKLGQLLYERTQKQLMEYSYDDNDILTKLKILNNQSQLETTREYLYTDGLLTSIKEKDKSNTFSREVRYTYDEKGNRVKGDLLTPYKDTLYTWKYIFNDKNILIGEQHIMYKPSLQKKDITLKLDEQDNVIGLSEVESEGTIKRERVMEVFNTISLQTSSYSYWMGELVDSTNYLYDFDEQGNWIKRISLTMQNKEIIQTRRITYYE